MESPTSPQPILGCGVVARVVRALVALSIIAALINSYAPGNYFFFFTILSNILAVVLMTGQALWPGWMRTNAMFRGAVTLDMTITGMVYAVLLAPIEADVGLINPWVNFVLHSVGPVALLNDWLLFPPERSSGARSLPIWLAFPALYFGVTLIRGPMEDWYPYPFLDPRGDGGYVGVAGYRWRCSWCSWG